MVIYDGPWPIARPVLASDDSVPGGKVFLLPPDWTPLPGESEEVWQKRIGPGACAFLDVMLPEEET
jgi:hypothetical protein